MLSSYQTILRIIMYLVNGCSFTYGDELERPESQRWSAHLEELADENVHNIAKCGSSNQKIFRTTIDALKKKKYEKMIIMWSDFARMEHISLNAYFQYGKAGVEGISEDMTWMDEDAHTQVSPARLQAAPWRYKRETYEEYYSGIYTNYKGIYDTIDYMDHVCFLGKILGCKVYQGWFHEGNRMTWAKTFSDSQLGFHGDKLYRIKGLIEKKMIEWDGNSRIGLPGTNSETFNEFTTKGEYSVMPKGHPGPEAHKGYAKYLYDNFIMDKE
jgi:hypothetical protein